MSVTFVDDEASSLRIKHFALRIAFLRRLNFRSLDRIDDSALVIFNGKFLVNGQMSGLSNMVGAVWYCENPAYTVGNTFMTKFVDFKDCDGNSLRIENGDTFTVSHVVNGNKSGKPLTASQGSLTMVSWLKDYQLASFNITS